MPDKSTGPFRWPVENLIPLHVVPVVHNTMVMVVVTRWWHVMMAAVHLCISCRCAQAKQHEEH